MQKPINVVHFINRIKEKSNMTISKTQKKHLTNPAPPQDKKNIQK